MWNNCLFHGTNVYFVEQMFILEISKAYSVTLMIYGRFASFDLSIHDIIKSYSHDGLLTERG